VEEEGKGGEFGGGRGRSMCTALCCLEVSQVSVLQKRDKLIDTR